MAKAVAATGAAKRAEEVMVAVAAVVRVAAERAADG